MQLLFSMNRFCRTQRNVHTGVLRSNFGRSMQTRPRLQKWASFLFLADWKIGRKGAKDNLSEFAQKVNWPELQTPKQLNSVNEVSVVVFTRLLWKLWLVFFIRMESKGSCYWHSEWICQIHTVQPSPFWAKTNFHYLTAQLTVLIVWILMKGPPLETRFCSQ